MEQNNDSQETKIARTILGAIAFVGFGWYLLGGGIEQHVAKDAKKQYEMTKRQGNAIEQCVQAQFVAAAYLQAKDEVNYQKWQRIKQQDCSNAGLPQ